MGHELGHGFDDRGRQLDGAGRAQAWKGTIEYLRQPLLTTPHAPPEHRANGAANNMPAFHEAFGTKPGDGMYREPGSRTIIW